MTPQPGPVARITASWKAYADQMAHFAAADSVRTQTED
jgi:hypothetical protein